MPAAIASFIESHGFEAAGLVVALRAWLTPRRPAGSRHI